MDRWYQVYHPRVNDSAALVRFQSKYEKFFNLIRKENPITLGEFGCGIGSVTKILMKSLPASSHVLVDTSVQMLRLTAENLGPGRYTLLRHDIRNVFNYADGFDVVHSHGVLEHFTDNEIRAIIDRQKTIARKLIHCVPSWKYEVPAYGDERLMTAPQWKKLCRPDVIHEINGGFELVLVWRGGRPNGMAQ